MNTPAIEALAEPLPVLTPDTEYIVTHRIPDVQTYARQSRLGFVRCEAGALLFDASGPGGTVDLDYGGPQRLEAAWIVTVEAVARNEAARYVGRPVRRTP
jgi:hypothetical protein